MFKMCTFGTNKGLYKSNLFNNLFPTNKYVHVQSYTIINNSIASVQFEWLYKSSLKKGPRERSTLEVDDWISQV